MNENINESILNLFKLVDNYKDKYIDFLYNICSYEARAYNKETIDAMVSYICDFAKNEGLLAKRTYMNSCGDFLTIEINEGKEKAALLMAHLDTVFEKGVFGKPAVRIEDDKMFGPGVIDCKGGIAIAILTLKALSEIGYEKHVRLILTSDEEISNILGGQEEIAFIQESAKGFRAAINCETAERDEVVVSRKGILKYRLDIHGASGHAGKHYFISKNAVTEAAYKAVAFHELSKENGTTYSVNIINGGTVLNVIPDNCSLSIDIRALTEADMKEAIKKVEEIAKKEFIIGTKCDVIRLSVRPPMEKNAETYKLLQELQDTCRKYNLGTLTPIDAGGGSDSCYTQLAGIPSICGMGASGGCQHTKNEFLTKDSIPLRAKILSSFLFEIQ